MLTISDSVHDLAASSFAVQTTLLLAFHVAPSVELRETQLLLSGDYWLLKHHSEYNIHYFGANVAKVCRDWACEAKSCWKDQAWRVDLWEVPVHLLTTALEHGTRSLHTAPRLLILGWVRCRFHCVCNVHVWDHQRGIHCNPPFVSFTLHTGPLTQCLA